MVFSHVACLVPAVFLLKGQSANLHRYCHGPHPCKWQVRTSQLEGPSEFVGGHAHWPVGVCDCHGASEEFEGYNCILFSSWNTNL